MRIAYLTGRSFRGAPTQPGVLPGYEADDFALALEAGAAAGLEFIPTYWDDAELSSRAFDAALVRSCWDYTGQAERFLSTLEGAARAGLRVINPPKVLRWNARKTYLQDLQKRALPVIPTVWADKADARAVARAFDELETAELVIKPQVGAGSQATLRLKRNGWSEADLFAGPQGAAMLQPFLPRIETEGELSLVFFNGRLSHTIRKTPVPGHWFANDLKARFTAIAPPDDTIAIGQAALSAAQEAAGGGVFYARVDLVLASAGDWRVIELELIEPYLFLALAADAAGNLARGLADFLAGG